jgi:Ni/Co efflux regulator RcnB
MMNNLILAATVSFAALAATPAVAQTAQDEARFAEAQRRLDTALANFRAEWDRYQAARGRSGRYSDQRYPPARDIYRDDDDEPYYDPVRDYRPGAQYRERVLAEDDRVYRGTDGRYYCRRSDGTTGLIVGGAAGGILGNVIDGGRSRTVGTLLGAALGGLAGRGIERNQEIRCR